MEHAKDILDSFLHDLPSNPSPKEYIPHSIKLARHIIEQANETQTQEEKDHSALLDNMINTPSGKIFALQISDQCIRCPVSYKAVDQLKYLLRKWGVPSFFPWYKRLGSHILLYIPTFVLKFLVPVIKEDIKKHMHKVLWPDDEKILLDRLTVKPNEREEININHLGEAVLGEREATERLNLYLRDLEKPYIHTVSVKLSSIYSQFSVISYDNTKEILKVRLRKLYRQAKKHPYQQEQTFVYKFINLDMEEYKDLHLTIEVFKEVLEEKDFHDLPAGIVLQAYLPESYPLMKNLINWGTTRFNNGGAPIKIRIVKGANLPMEKVEASLYGWNQAPYDKKEDVDANYKRMMFYALKKEYLHAIRIGIASHNIFDVSLAILIAYKEKSIHLIDFEMLEGMADPIKRVIHHFVDRILLYCPVSNTKHMHHAMAYLIRRLDENTSTDNFLRYSFKLNPHTSDFKKEEDRFTLSFEHLKDLSSQSRRQQNRLQPSVINDIEQAFTNESDTDFTLSHNRIWLHKALESYKNHIINLNIPLPIGGKNLARKDKNGVDPSEPNELLYTFTQASKEEMLTILDNAHQALPTWQATSIQDKVSIFVKTAQLYRENRGKLIASMVYDGGKSVLQGDPEVSEAIDFCEYYARQALEMFQSPNYSLKPKGVIAVISPWNFPLAIPTGGIVAALITGNTVILKPASDTVLIAWELIQLLWKAGVPKDVLQFMPARGIDVEKNLIANHKLNGIILTGSTQTAKSILKKRPSIDLWAETGGKNTVILTDLCDEDLSIKEVVDSAFGHNGQKCSATSLLICKKELYENPSFLKQLKDATQSLVVGKAKDLNSKITPLIHSADPILHKGLTTLETGETWLVKPTVDKNNPNLWSPGVKLGVKRGSFCHKTELFGPVLSVICAKHLQEAIEIANDTPYGLTGGLFSLDDREKVFWKKHIEVGNQYINRGTTGAIVQRQPFGGCKASNYGYGCKAGGEHYLYQFVTIEEQKLAQNSYTFNKKEWQDWHAFLEIIGTTDQEKEIWMLSLASYIYWYENYFSQHRDLSKVLGQDNLSYYVARKKIAFRVNPHDKRIDILRVILAATLTKTPLEISYAKAVSGILQHPDFPHTTCVIKVSCQKEEEFLDDLKQHTFDRVRILNQPSQELLQILHEKDVSCVSHDVVSSGKLELLHYLREVSLSENIHRYGNIVEREF